MKSIERRESFSVSHFNSKDPYMGKQRNFRTELSLGLFSPKVKVRHTPSASFSSFRLTYEITEFQLPSSPVNVEMS